jgi:indolepyruvate decarboxylase
MTLAHSLLRALERHGAREIFGIPGDFAMAFFRAVEAAGILPLYTLSHEPAVGFAADAAARARPGLGVAAVTYGAGALNMVNAVASAYAEKSPVVVIYGAPGRDEANSGLLLHHQAKTLGSQAQIYREVTCDQATLDDAARAPHDIARVLRSCLTYSQPVYIELPRDMVDAPCEPVARAPELPFDRDALAACADEVLARIAAAKSPVTMVGVEVRRFGLEARVAELAARLRIPVVTSFLGRGLLTQTATPPLGTYLGVAGAPAITELVEGSDALLLLGVVVCDGNFAVSARQIDLRHAIQALDRRVTLGHHTYVDVPLAALVDAMLERLPGKIAPHPHAPLADAHRNLVADEAPIAPGDIAAAVNDLIAAGHRFPLAADMGDCLFTAMDIAHTALVAPAYFASMGFGVPAGIGVQATLGLRPLVLVGDGAFQMTGWELGNCRRHGLDPIVIVFNNRSWEMLHTFEPQAKFTELDDWHFADAAKALGGDGVRVHTRRELRDALARAAATRGRFQLVEAMIPRGVLSPTLERFVAGVKRLSSLPA